MGGRGSDAVYFRANMAHTRQPRPDSGTGSQVNDRNILQVVPSSPGSGIGCLSGVSRRVRQVQVAVERIWRIRQSRPDSGLGIQVKARNTFTLLPLRSAAGLAAHGCSAAHRLEASDSQLAGSQ